MAIRFGLLTAILSLVLACGGSSTQPPPPQTINAPSPAAASERPAASPAAAAPSLNPTAARAVPATPVIVAGTPAAGQLSVTALQRAWELRNYQVQLGSAGGSAGFTAPAAEVRLIKGTTSTQITLLVYPSPQALEQEWDIKPGTAPTPKAGKETPGVLATWWNNNVVALVRSRTGEPSPDALNAFLDARP